MDEGPALARELLTGEGEDRPDGQVVVDSLTAVMAEALRRDEADLLAGGVSALIKIWELGEREAMYPTVTPDFEASLWETILLTLYALGGLAVANGQWAAARELTRQSPPSTKRDSWLRHGQVASARAAQYDDSLLELAAVRLRELNAGLDGGKALAAVAQFDLIAGLIISETDSDGFYPNAAEFGATLVERLVIDHVRSADSDLRHHVFAGNPAGLREALRNYDAQARLQAALHRYDGREWRWRAFEDARTGSTSSRGTGSTT